MVNLLSRSLVDFSDPAAPGVRILAIDHWTRGVFNFTRLRSHLESQRADLTLLHWGSLRSHGVKRLEHIDGILCIDVRTFEGMNLDQIIAELAPDLVLLLNIHTLLERSVILTCRRMGIPTVYLQHGIMPDPDVLPFQCESVRVNTRWNEYIRKVPRYFRLLVMYLRARRYQLDSGFFRVAWAQLRSPRLSMFFPKDTVELTPARSLVFYDRDADFLRQTHGIARSEICVVGNPELDAAYERLNSPIVDCDKRRLRRSVGLAEQGPLLFYPDESFADSHLYGWNECYASERLEELLDICANAGWQLLIRPRHVAAVGDLSRKVGKHRAAVSRDLSIVDAIDISDCVLGTVSSVLENAVVLNRQILVPLWYLNNRAQDSPYLRAGKATSVDSPVELLNALARAGNASEERLPHAATSPRTAALKRHQACEAIVSELVSIARRNPSNERSDD